MEFHVTIDFNDDLWYAEQPWDEARLRGLIRSFAARGIRGIHWLDQGGINDGIHDRGGYIDRLGTAYDFIQRVPHPLKVVADEAHKLGMSVFSVIKCFDLCCSMPWCARPVGDRGDPPVGLPYIGGEGVLAHRWIREHPEFRAELHPALQEKLPRKPIRTIRLWHHRSGLAPTGFKLYVSSNNRKYQQQTGFTVTTSERRRRTPVFATAPEQLFGPEELCSCIEFTGLNIADPFIAIEPESHTELSNTLIALAELEDSDGKSVEFTCGLIPVMSPEDRDPNWRTGGIGFDAAINTPVPGRGWTMTSSGGRTTVDLRSHGFLGIARGRNKYLGGMVEMAYPQVRNWLTQLAVNAVEAGCDGVDLRVTTHTESLDWENYGFGAPIVAEYKQRYGVDISHESFDRSLWRKLRGEYFEQTLLEMRAAVNARGKRLSFQLQENYDHPSTERCFHEIFWDWRKYLHQTDIVNFTQFAFRRDFYPEAVRLCQKAGRSMMMTPSMHSAPDETWAAEGRELFDHCLRDGFKVFNIYESAAVVRLGKKDFEFRCPTLWKLISEYISK